MLEEYTYNVYLDIEIYIYLERAFMMASTSWRTWVTLTRGQRKGLSVLALRLGRALGTDP